MPNWNAEDTIKDVDQEFSCGVLVSENDKQLVIALSKAAGTSEYGHVISIPKEAVKGCQYFTKPGAAKKAKAVPPPTKE